VIEGYRVEIGREAFLDRGSYIGGGSCFSKNAFLKAGHWFHMGIDSHVNVAMGVTIGDAVGLGITTKIFTHGSYIDSFNLGAPVQWAPVVIGSNVWLPNAWVNPGVLIGDNVIAAAMTLINRDIPSGSLVGGVPVKILSENLFPRKLSELEKLELVNLIEKQCRLRLGFNLETVFSYELNVLTIIEGDESTFFNLQDLIIGGDVTNSSKVVKDQLRRNGIRFRYEFMDNTWQSWSLE
jgi:acetyltransferase-like isoleucine patch superfamily enzyme